MGWPYHHHGGFVDHRSTEEALLGAVFSGGLAWGGGKLFGSQHDHGTGETSHRDNQTNFTPWISGLSAFAIDDPGTAGVISGLGSFMAHQAQHGDEPDKQAVMNDSLREGLIGFGSTFLGSHLGNRIGGSRHHYGYGRRGGYFGSDPFFSGRSLVGFTSPAYQDQLGMNVFIGNSPQRLVYGNYGTDNILSSLLRF